MTRLATAPEGASNQPTPVKPETLGSQRLCSIHITGGFLDGAEFDLADGLNCLIGARGTGKTSVLELVRYALDVLPTANDPERQRIENLVRANLGDGAVELLIETRDGLAYKVIRSWTGDPIVVMADGSPTEITLRAGGPRGVFRADIYSQNEIERIADQALSQLSLIDNFEAGRIAQITGELRTLTSKLATNATTLMPLQDQIDGLNSEIAGKDAIQQKIDALGPITGQNAQAVTKGQQAKSLRQRETQTLDSLWQFLQEYDQQVADLSGQVASRTTQWMTREMLTGPNGQALTGVKQKLLDGGAEIDELLRQTRSCLSKMQDALGDAGTSLSGTHARQEAAYQELIKHDAALRGQAAERSRLEKMKNDLLAKQRQRDAIIEKQAGLQRERTQLLQKLSELRDSRYNVRKATAQRINTALMPDIRVTIEQSGHLGHYRAMLEQALAGARVQRGVVAQRIVERIMPADLVVLVRRGDTGGLVQRANLNEEQARKVVDVLKNTEALYALETVELADRPRIELKDGEGYKDSAALSTGQKCTTILPILLLDSDTPLMVDQPEDNLDNRFVCESVVKSIRKVKSARQLVFVTHNPNIPVLADAERVFVLESDGAHARKAAEGDVDECRDAIVNLLEGGEQAFKRRQERYAYR
jgi:ABC-type lipoprotein export system ATPase subunit